MSEVTNAPAGDSAPAEYTPHELGNMFAEARMQPDTAESADDDATAEHESPAEGGPESPETGTTEGDDEAEPAKPAIDPPKSWTKDLHDHWASLDPVLQERIVTRDREDQAAIKRAFNEAAEVRKAAEADRTKVEEARQTYEAKTKAALEVLEREQLRDFPDIKTMADVAKMAMEDPFRKIQWDVHQDQIRAATWEAQQSEQRKSQEHQTKWAQHVNEENARAAELIPELTDKVKGPALMTKAAERLAELGFKPEELNDLASGKQKLSIYDHRIQQLIFSDLKLKDIQSAPKAVIKPKLPPVQRPGTSQPKSSAQSDTIKNLSAKLDNGGDHRDLGALIGALRRA